MAIKSIDYNFGQFQDHKEAGTTYDTFTVGKKFNWGVVEEINKYGDGNSSYCRVKFDTETIIDVYNVNFIEYVPLVTIEIRRDRTGVYIIDIYKEHPLETSSSKLVDSITKESFKPIEEFPGIPSGPIDYKEAFEYALRKIREKYKNCIIKEKEIKNEEVYTQQ